MCVLDKEDVPGFKASLTGLARRMTGAGIEERVVLESTDNAYTSGGVFEGDRTLDFLRREIDEAIDGGFSPLWLAGEAASALHPEMDLEEFFLYEVRVKLSST